MFNKPRRSQQLRKKRKLTDEEVAVEEEDGAAAAQDILEGVKELQKQRHANHGINPDEVQSRILLAEKKARQQKEAAETVAKEDTGGLLNSFFQQTSEKSKLDEKMDEFIERNLQLARGEDPDAKVLKIKDAEDLLYETPAELQPPTSLVRESEVSGVADIKEVELSVDLKLKNIERTEAARVEAQAKAATKSDKKESVMLIPQNFSANFRDHRFDVANRAASNSYVPGKGKGKGGAKGGGAKGGGDKGGRGGSGGGRSSDDMMLERFKRKNLQFRRR